MPSVLTGPDCARPSSRRTARSARNCCATTLDSASTQPPPWYAAAVHPVLRAPLQAVHEHPGHAWTVPELAALGGVSRATFARVVRQVLGRTPMSYLSDWRMTLARDDLRTGTDTLDALAHRYGYGSAYSVSATSSRYHDQ